jgi:hypothetical protein
VSQESNDRAFIKLSKELICVRNDLEALVLLKIPVSVLNTYNVNKLVHHRGDKTHSPELAGLSKAIEYMASDGKLNKAIEKAQTRVTELERLCEAYMRGEDIIQAKLARD